MTKKISKLGWWGIGILAASVFLQTNADATEPAPTITLRSSKGAPLSSEELDNNFIAVESLSNDREVDVAQTAHGLASGNLIRHDGANYVKAQSDSDANATVVGVVKHVGGVNAFTLQRTGIVDLGAPHGFTIGGSLYLSDTVAGAMTETKPDDIAVGVGFAVSDTEVFLSPISAQSSLTVTAFRALVSDENGKVAVSTTSSTEIGYVSGVESSIQAQLDGKVSLTGDQAVGGVKTFSSSPVIPTPTAGDNTTKAASTAFVQGAAGAKVGLTGNETVAGVKTFSSSPVIPTPTAGDNTTKAASTAFVKTAIDAIPPGAFVPVGGIIMWSGAVENIPESWALCDGNNGTPNLTDRFIVGAGNSYAVGDTGGAATVTLTVNQIPSHAHNFGVVPYNDVAFSAGSSQVWAVDVLDTAWQVDETESKGGGQSHENRPPYYALALIMRIE